MLTIVSAVTLELKYRRLQSIEASVDLRQTGVCPTYPSTVQHDREDGRRGGHGRRDANLQSSHVSDSTGVREE